MGRVGHKDFMGESDFGHATCYEFRMMKKNLMTMASQLASFLDAFSFTETDKRGQIKHQEDNEQDDFIIRVSYHSKLRFLLAVPYLTSTHETEVMNRI